MPIFLLDVQAQWGYSEIFDSNFERCYDNGYDIDTLRAKRRAGIAFGQLSLSDRYNLAFQCCGVRPNLLRYLTGITAFELVQITRSQVADLLVPPKFGATSRAALFPSRSS